MNSSHFIRVCGSIAKKESLIPWKKNILPNTSVAEANLPYSNYYGTVPEKAIPNSIFLFTKEYYTLEEVLRFSQKIKSCALDKLNVATATVTFSSNQSHAIRIKYLPDYQHIRKIQECFEKQGVILAKKIHIENEAFIKINKCFILEEIEENIYMDYEEKNKGYLLSNRLLIQGEFYELLNNIRLNGNCRLFDAAKGGIIINSEVKEIMRIYSEQLDTTLLKCIQNQVNKIFKQKLQAHY
ncbi:hypothetical protein GM418_02000 [Maribellus comscasis]|uniref:Uncharacterized protein n=1 Tax=Maribellus comscasis TaxID=2681766 RepID=A0A6I6JN25_9BACT|nr:hypothetical protein [Maribellus comscasis]QGY42468.1 hypothetical protein GM418_02000 [Maribellus comscasis]